MKIYYGLILVILLWSCSNAPNKFEDKTIVEIINYQDRRLTDSLLHHLINKNSIYRSEAALALGSVQDSSASLQLGSSLLEDPVTDVRVKAAFALGQTAGYAAVNALIPALTDSNSLVVKEVLIALGKTVGKEDLRSITGFQPKDSLQEEGLAWGFYYAGLRGQIDSVMVKRVKDLSTSKSKGARLGAAHFFNRSALKIIPVKFLKETILSDPNPEIRMAGVLALRKTNSSQHHDILKGILSNDVDYRVRVNAARVAAITNDPLNTDLIEIAMKDANHHVAVAASENLAINSANKSAILAAVKRTNHFRVKANLYKALLQHSDSLVAEVTDTYKKATNDYEKVSLIGALSSQQNTYSFLFDEMKSAKALVIKTAIAQSLVNINKNESFNVNLKKTFADIYRHCILDGDAGVIGIIASALADSALGYKEEYSDYNFLTEAKKKLQLPRDYEALQPLEDALAHFEGKPKPAPPQNVYNHPINWELVKQIKQGQLVIIETTRGNITLKLLVNEAPGSVANFVTLVNNKYFDKRFFHRVVPNFVIQAGCNRGDGYGSEDYSIRSEFYPNSYSTGSVGMASAGKDTEGTQWFITHSPAPHLQGRYTLFAEVTEGMNVVHEIQIGDQIISARLANN